MNIPARFSKPLHRRSFTLAVFLFLTLSFSGAAEAASNLRLGLPASYSIRGTRCTLKVHRVFNYSRAGTISGPLSLQLWVTKQRYRGRSIPGFKVATSPIGRLHGRFYFHDINRVARYHRPPGGRYFAVLLLVESNQIVSYVNFAHSQHFGHSRAVPHAKTATESVAQTVLSSE